MARQLHSGLYISRGSLQLEPSLNSHDPSNILPIGTGDLAASGHLGFTPTASLSTQLAFANVDWGAKLTSGATVVGGWSAGEPRIIKDNQSADVFGFGHNGTTVVLFRSADDGATWSIVKPSSGNFGDAIGSNEFGVLSACQTSDGAVHIVSTSLANAFRYWRVFLDHQNGVITNFTVDVGPIVLPGTYGSSEYRGMMIAGFDANGAECLIGAFADSPAAATPNAFRVQMMRSTGIRPGATTDFVKLDGTAGATVAASVTDVNANTSHRMAPWIAQIGSTRDIILVYGGTNTGDDGGAAGVTAMQWARVTASGATWSVGSFTAFGNFGTGTASNLGGLYMCGTQNSAWLFYSDPSNGLHIDRWDSSGTRHADAVTQPETTAGLWSYGVMACAQDDSRLWVIWNASSDLTTWHNKSGFWNGAAWKFTTDAAAEGDSWGLFGSAQWSEGLVAAWQDNADNGIKLATVRGSGAIFAASGNLTFSPTAALTTGTGGATFAAAGALSFTPAASLTTAIQMAGAASLGFTPAAALTTKITCAAAAALTFTPSASLTTGINLAAAGALSFSASAALTTSIQLAAAASATFTPSAALTTSIQLAGTGSLSFTAAAALTASIKLAASGSLTFTPAAALTTSIQLAASGTTTFTATAALATGAQFAAVGSLSFSAAAALTTSIQLAASSSTTFSATVALTTSIQLAAAANLSFTSTAALTTAIRLAATGSLTFTPTAALSTTGTGATFAAAASWGFTPSASLTTSITMAAAGSLSTAPTAALSTAIRMAASGSLSFAPAAALNTGILFAANAAWGFSSSAAIQTAITMQAAGALAFSGSAALSTAIRLQAAAAWSLIAVADLHASGAPFFGVGLSVDSDGIYLAAVAPNDYAAGVTASETTASVSGSPLLVDVQLSTWTLEVEDG